MHSIDMGRANKTTFKQGDCLGEKNPRWNHNINEINLKDLIDKGLDGQKISEILGISKSCACKRLNRYGLKPIEKPPLRVTLICEICHTVYEVVPSLKKSRFCSPKCYHEFSKSKDMSVVLRGHKWRDTKPEIEIRKALNELNIKFEAHKHIGKYEIDFYLPDFKICLEVFGVYWHTLPNSSIKDGIKFSYLRSQGYRTLYYWDDDISNKKIDLKSLLIDEILQVGVGIPVEANDGAH